MVDAFLTSDNKHKITLFKCCSKENNMNVKMLKAAVAGLVLSVSGFANAGLIVDLYGDIDGTYSFGGGIGITDVHLSASQFWTQSFVLDGTVVSASIEIGHAQLGYFMPADWGLYLDGVFVNILTDMDVCDGTGSGTGGCAWEGSYTVDILSVINLSTLEDGVANFEIRTGSSDGWSLDYSKLSIETASVPEPSTLAIFALGLMGLASRRFLLVNKKQ